MIGLTSIKNIYVSIQVVDMRKSFDGLCGCVEKLFDQDPLNGNLFVFFNRRHTMVKMLFWDRTGFCIFAKRLESGTFSLKNLHKSGSIDTAELYCILDGIELHGSIRRKRYLLN